LIFFAGLLHAQQDTVYYKTDYKVIIDSIEITGNETTEDFVILRELTFSIGDTLTPKLAAYNRERIYSLNIFNDVKLIPYTYNEKNILRIDIKESWYIYPVPFITLKDKDWKKLSYGVAVSLYNFRGRNETLTGVAALGYDPAFSFSYQNPNISYNENIIFRLSIGYGTVTNKSTTAEYLYGNSFEQKNIVSRASIGKRFGKFHWLNFETGFDYIETPFYIKKINASDERIDRTIVIGLSYIYDTRDLRQYAKNGIYGYLGYQFKGLGINKINYRVADLDFREYRSFFDKFTAKWRVAIRHTSGAVIPYYDYSYIGYSERVRGYFHGEKMEGNDRILGSVELNYPVVEEWRLNFDFIPLLPKSLLSYRVALIAELFSDTGTTKNNGDPVSVKDFNTGYGGGLSLLFLPYAIFRLEYAINDNANSEWIFDVGVSF